MKTFKKKKKQIDGTEGNGEGGGGAKNTPQIITEGETVGEKREKKAGGAYEMGGPG